MHERFISNKLEGEDSIETPSNHVALPLYSRTSITEVDTMKHMKNTEGADSILGNH